MLARDESATGPYKIGLIYRVAKAGPICRTPNVLDTATHNGVTTEEQVEVLGCVMIDPARSSKVVVLGKGPDALKVRIIAPNQGADAFEGWTDFQTLGIDPVLAK
jgi:hypothetical protein